MPSIEKFDPTYIEEMRGIAEGANEPFAAVVLMNARTEMVAAARQEQEAKQVPDGCTAALALPEASADGVLLHGQNWDWRAECAETGVLLRIHRDDGPDILTFTEAGGLARSGLNSAGIGAHGQRPAMRPRLQARPRHPSALHPPQGAGERLSRQCGAAPSCRRPGSAPTTWR